MPRAIASNDVAFCLMVVRYELPGMDLAEVRFAISPMNELVLSLRTWRDPGRYPAHLPWVRQVDDVRSRLDAELLLALINTRLSTPDFLIPRPDSPLTRIEDQFDQLSRIDLAVIAQELRDLHRDQTWPDGLRGSGRARRSRIVSALREYWQLCFAPHWPRMQALLEADVMYRAREMAQRGIGVMLAGLEPAVDFADNVVSIHLRSPISYTRSASGTGLTLVPTLFTSGPTTPSSPEAAPMIHYGVRGLGTLWQTERPATAATVAALIGATRTNLLIRLAVPASSTELALRLGISTSAVNQHLRALQAGGLLTSARYGRAVLYHRSPLGDALLGPT
jgi:DNA-binding transcriptional ArsR family regulator